MTSASLPDAPAPEQSLRLVGSGIVERMLGPVHRWVWSSPRRRAQKLLGFSATEADSGRDMARAAEHTGDPLLRRLYLRHSQDEARHAKLFAARGRAILAEQGAGSRGPALQADWVAPGEHGLDDLEVDRASDASLLAFLFLAERAGARRFVAYGRVLGDDPETRDVFRRVLRDEAFHTNYSHAQLGRVSGGLRARHLFLARLGRLWKGYLRVASALGGAMGAVVLTAQYFLVLPVFAALARRSATRELPGWSPCRAPAATSLRGQY